MKFEIVIDADCDEKVVVYAHERSRLVDELEQLVLQRPLELVGRAGKSAVMFEPSDVYCFIVENGKVYALTVKEKLQLDRRLYQLESQLSDGFVKINQSCIANFKKIDRFSASFSGALEVRFKNGYTDYVSRRRLKYVKERLGL